MAEDERDSDNEAAGNIVTNLSGSYLSYSVPWKGEKGANATTLNRPLARSGYRVFDPFGVHVSFGNHLCYYFKPF